MPYPANNTATLFLDYNTCGHGHTMQIRFNDPDTIGDAMTELDGFLDALGNSHRLLTVEGARVRLKDSDVTSDVVWTGNATYGTGVGSEQESAQFYNFIGRTAPGTRVRIAVFGAITNNYQGKYRAPATSDLAFSGALGVLDNAEGTFLAADGFQPVWKQYVNLGDNAYWRNHIR